MKFLFRGGRERPRNMHFPQEAYVNVNESNIYLSESNIYLIMCIEKYYTYTSIGVSPH